MWQYTRLLLQLQVNFIITISNGTITIPVLNRNYYVHNLCSIQEIQSSLTKVERTKVKVKPFFCCQKTLHFQKSYPNTSQGQIQSNSNVDLNRTKAKPAMVLV